MSCCAKKPRDPPPYQQHHTPYLQATQRKDFAPPDGPPPGWGGGQTNNRPSSFTAASQLNGPGLSQRPNSSHYPCENSYNPPQPQPPNYNDGHLVHYDINHQNLELQQQLLQQQRLASASSWHNQPNTRPMPMPMIFPPSMYTWWNSDSSLGTFIEFGMSPKGDPMFSGKLSMSSGKLTLRREKFKRNGEHLGEAKLKSPTNSKYLIKLPSGQEIEYNAKFTFPYRGSIETWSWAGSSKSIGDKLSDKLNEKLTGKDKSYQLVGQATGVVAAIILAEGDDFSDFSLTSDKKQIGRFEFRGPVLSGELGNDFATVAIIAFLRVKQKEVEKKLVKAIFKGVGGL